ncbi:hypothetical protein DL96DRAFT_816179 [Flagelloscypha sp. PMI_526]|nr:hypothetical protein DL96DRAFT_816179 [Flagelloscypha sp. PMI_526]
MTLSRRNHTKSRFGCRSCKRRRVKCDETGYPQCKNCETRDIECDWPELYAPLQEEEMRPVHAHLQRQPFLAHPFDMNDLELLHHFTTSTCTSFLDVASSGSQQIIRTYQQTAPKVALSHPFLMHALQALSALHLHWLNRDSPTSRSGHYYELSCYHRTQAILSYNRNKCPDPHLSPNSNCSCNQLSQAQRLNNMILSLHSHCDAMLSAANQTSSVFRVAYWLQQSRRELKTVYCLKDGGRLVGPETSAGPSIFFLPSPTSSSFSLNSPSSTVSLSHLLYSLHLPGCGAPDDTELIQPAPSNTADIYAEMVRALHVGFRLFFEQQVSLRVILTWAGEMLPEETTAFLFERRPRAIIVLAHFTAMDRWCQFQGASWWNLSANFSALSLQLREMLPNEPWKHFFDTTFQGIPCGLLGQTAVVGEDLFSHE